MSLSQSYYKVIFNGGDPMGVEVKSRSDGRNLIAGRFPNAVTNFASERKEEDDTRLVEITTFWENHADKDMDQEKGNESRAVAWLHQIWYKNP